MKSAPRRRTRPAPAKKRFKVYILDSGWDTPAHHALEKALSVFTRHLAGHEVFLLDGNSSDDFLERHPHLIGLDPIITVVESGWPALGGAEYGARLVLGRMESEQRTRLLLKMLLRLINTPELAADLPGAIRRFVHKEGLRGSFDIILESTALISSETHERAHLQADEAPDDFDDEDGEDGEDGDERLLAAAEQRRT